MGLLSGLLENVMGGALAVPQHEANPLVQAALQLLQQNGGVSGLVELFRQQGYGPHVDSWVGTGQNLPINGEQLQRVLGSGALGAIASRLGLSHGELSSRLAQTLPQLIDHMTPTGAIPDNQHDLIQRGLGALMTKLSTG
jgi:uncharacterized protein YidB (DUF937 family)